MQRELVSTRNRFPRHKVRFCRSPNYRENRRTHQPPCKNKVSPEKHIVLLVDGHSSRDGVEWITACEKMKNILVRLPANTTHILQPCGQFVNRSFQRIVRETRDHLLSMSHLWVNTAYKIKLAVAGYQSISPENARASFIKCGLWPMNYRFVHFATFSES